MKWPKTFIVVSHAREFLNMVLPFCYLFSSSSFLQLPIDIIIFCFSLQCCSYFQVVTDIIHLQGQKLTAYKGNYDAFEKTRQEQIKNQQKAVEANDRARSHMQVFSVELSLNNTNCCCIFLCMVISKKLHQYYSFVN